MLHLALTLQLLAPTPDVPRDLSLFPSERVVQPISEGSLLSQRLSAAGGVVAAQAASVGLAAVAEQAFGSGRFEPFHPSFVAGLTVIAAGIALTPVGAALAASFADPDPHSFASRLQDAIHLRGIQGALLAGVELVAAFAGSLPLALAGVVALLGSDLVAMPMAVSHGPPVDLGLPAGGPPAEAPPHVGFAF